MRHVLCLRCLQLHRTTSLAWDAWCQNCLDRGILRLTLAHDEHRFRAGAVPELPVLNRNGGGSPARWIGERFPPDRQDLWIATLDQTDMNSPVHVYICHHSQLTPAQAKAFSKCISDLYQLAMRLNVDLGIPDAGGFR